MKFRVFISLFCLSLVFTQCKKETVFEDLTYLCLCGGNTWNGDSYPLTDAHWITTDTTTGDLGLEIITGKDYYTTAKIELENGVEPHSLNMKLSIPDLSEGVQISLEGAKFFEAHPDSNSVNISIEEVNFNSLSVVDDYAVLAGAFELLENPFTGVDNVTFDLEVVQVVNGSAAGFPFVFSGSFTASKEETE